MHHEFVRPLSQAEESNQAYLAWGAEGGFVLFGTPGAIRGNTVTVTVESTDVPSVEFNGGARGKYYEESYPGEVLPMPGLHFPLGGIMVAHDGSKHQVTHVMEVPISTSS